MSDRLTKVAQQVADEEVQSLRAATLTDAEREALTLFSGLAWTALRWSEVERHAATLRGLLERHE